MVTVRFRKQLPPMHQQLWTQGEQEIILEVEKHIDDTTVQGIAVTPTRGLARGDSVLDMGHPFRVPVGNRVLGKAFNVMGKPMA